MLRSKTALLLLLCSSGLPASAQAAGWSAPVTLGTSGASGFGEPGARVAVAEGDRLVAAWANTHTSDLFAAAGRADGRLGAQRVGSGLRPAVAINRAGAAVVVFAEGRSLRAAVRAPGARRFGPARAITTPAARFDAADSPQVAADAAGRFVVLYERSSRTSGQYVTDVRALTLTAAGRPTGEAQSFGEGDLPDRSEQALADGRIVALIVLTTRPTPDTPVTFTRQLLRRDARGAAFSATPIVTPKGFDAGQLTAAPDGRLALAGLDITSSGDAGSAGRPLAAGFAEDAFGAFAGPTVRFPNRNFDPVAIPADAGRVGLLWQQKTAPSDFERAAPIVATTIGPGEGATPPTQLSARAAREPQAVTLPGGRGLAVWDDAGRWGGAELTADGSWRRVAAPSGRPSPFHDAITNRDLVASATGEAAFVWQERGRIRLSVRR